MSTVINFYEIDHEDFDNEVLVGSVRVENGTLLSDDPEILAIANTAGDTIEAVLDYFGDWSNGYLRSEAVEAPVMASGTIALIDQGTNSQFHLAGVHDQSTHGRPRGGSAGGGRGATGVIRSKGLAPGMGMQRAVARGNFSPEVEQAIRDFGHDPADYAPDGKPIPGTASWLDAHGIDKKVYDARPMKRYEGKNDPTINEFYDDPRQVKFAKKVASQSDGIIMQRTAVPGAEEHFGPIVAQIRPDNRILLDNRDLVRGELKVTNAQKRYDEVSKWTPQDVINERKGKVRDAEQNLKDLKTSTPDEIRIRANEAKGKADANLKKAQKSGDDLKIAKAEEEATKAKYAHRAEMRKADLLEKDQERAIGIAEQELHLRKRNLASAEANPDKTLKAVQDYSRTQIDKRQSQLDKVRVKYIFPPGENTASRIEANPDAQNIKNLVSGKGRVYFAMEGNIKADAVLSQVKKEDPTAAVISVPSVTAWPKHGETEWVAQKYLKGRDVILIPDADGVHNKAVMDQSIKLKGKLISSGVENVTIASPPLIPGKRKDAAIQPLKYPTGVKDARKGIDDHIGLGKGTLGDLVFDDSKTPKFDLSDVAREKKIRSSAVPNMNRTLEAISDLSASTDGTARISHKALSQYTNIPESSIKGSNGTVRKLEKAGIIKVHDIFDPKLLGEGRREPAMDVDEIRRLTKKAGVGMPDIDIKFIDDENNYETVAIIEILDPKYIKPPGSTKSLSSKYKTLKTSPGAPKAEPPSKRASKKPGSPSAISSFPGKRIVQTPEGAARYGVPVGQPIPETSATGIITLSSGTMDEGPSSQFHLAGQHNQKDHAHGGGGSGSPTSSSTPTSSPNATGIIRKALKAHETSKNAKALSKEVVGDEDKFHIPEGLKKRTKDSVKKAAWKGAKKIYKSKAVRRWVMRAAIKLALAYAGQALLKYGMKQLVIKYTLRPHENHALSKGAAYTMKAQNGQMLKLYDTTGKVGKDEANKLLGALNEIHGKHPIGGDPPALIIHDRHPMVGDAHAFVIGKRKSRNIMINRDVLNDVEGERANLARVPNNMGGRYFGQTHPQNRERYIVFHEYGHIADFNNENPANEAKGKAAYMIGKRLKRPDGQPEMSLYGHTNRREGYAESFADWYTTDGETTNRATNMYANTFGWNKG